MKLTWSDAIGFMSNLNGTTASSVSYGQWSADAFPAPEQKRRFEGDSFYMIAGSPSVYYRGPLVDRAITFSEWAGAGMPSPEIRSS